MGLLENTGMQPFPVSPPRAICLQKQEAGGPMQEATSVTFNVITTNKHLVLQGTRKGRYKECFLSQVLPTCEVGTSPGCTAERTRSLMRRKQGQMAAAFQKPGKVIWGT